MIANKQRATLTDIIERIHRLLGPEVDKVILQAIALLLTGDAKQGLYILRQLDCEIGGFGLHSLVPGAETEIPYERALHRPIQYVEMVLQSNALHNLTRHLTEMACAHVEAILKKSARLTFLDKIRDDYKPVPMGALLYKAQHRISPSLYSDLYWLNQKVYTFAKHEYGDDVFTDNTSEKSTHLFTLHEAVMIYFIARKLVVSLEQSKPLLPS